MDTALLFGWQLLQLVLIGSGLFCTLIGALTVFHWFKQPTFPNDDSNRINNIAAWWIGLTRPEVLGQYHKFFRQDVMKNVTDVDKTSDVE